MKTNSGSSQILDGKSVFTTQQTLYNNDRDEQQNTLSLSVDLQPVLELTDRRTAAVAREEWSKTSARMTDTDHEIEIHPDLDAGHQSKGRNEWQLLASVLERLVLLVFAVMICICI